MRYYWFAWQLAMSTRSTRMEWWPQGSKIMIILEIRPKLN